MVEWITTLEERTYMTTGLLKPLDQVEGLHALHAADDLDLVRVPLGNGMCAWCGKYSGGLWAVVGVAPLGSLWDQEAVDRKLFFAAPWPADWITRYKREQTEVQSRREAIGLTVGAYVGGKGANHDVRLAQVARVDEAGRPTGLWLTPAERETGQVCDMAEEPRAWFPIPDKFTVGAGIMFANTITRSKGVHSTWHFLTKRLGISQKRTAARAEKRLTRAIKAEARKAQPSAAQTAREAMQTAPELLRHGGAHILAAKTAHERLAIVHGNLIAGGMPADQADEWLNMAREKDGLPPV